MYGMSSFLFFRSVRVSIKVLPLNYMGLGAQVIPEVRILLDKDNTDLNNS